MTASWQPRLVALDIDGTLLRWVEGSGAVHGEVDPVVRDAVRRAAEAGAEIVLASGRSLHSMLPIADQLGLPYDGERCWIVASNGAVVLRYPPAEIVHEETFDASEAVRDVLRLRPGALVGVEERGKGYRVNRHFPDGELAGEMIVTPVEEMVSRPVSRVIIRDPEATVEDFERLAKELGLHGTDYVIGWTAWMDLAPLGISKASGLARVASELGIEAADALAIGDGRNDLEMFDWAGRSVAMGQAVPEVLAAADHVTLAVDDHGAAVELDRWFGPSGG
ncbi:HAD family hydrolase [Nocardioides daejeonensis]|uniref:HAD family hydrolase n=1 Tax=Nocardioides daejeonensis TaxID=1046556 RepID=UPI000D74F169|nr:HAD family hydrolase [Nocardioides daejeonensis]